MAWLLGGRLLLLAIATVVQSGAVKADVRGNDTKSHQVTATTAIACEKPDATHAKCVCDGVQYDFSVLRPSDSNVTYFSARDKTPFPDNQVVNKLRLMIIRASHIF